MKFRAEITGTIYIEAESREDARQIAGEKSTDEWDWDIIDIEQWD